MSRRSTLLPLAALLLLAPACTKSGPDDPAKQAEVAEVAKTESNVAAEPAPATAEAPPVAAAKEVTTTNALPVIKVLDAGQEPREPLRVSVVAGQRETMVMTMTMGMDMNMGALGAVPKMDLPPIEMTMGIHVTSVSDTGDFRYEFSLDNVSVKDRPGLQPGMAEAMREAMTGIVGLRGSSVISNRGEVREATFKIPDNMPAQVKQTMESMQQSIQQIAVPFPEEAVGIGAKWEVSSTLAQVGGITLSQVSNYELIERDGDLLTMTTSLTQDAPRQVMKAPGMPATATATLESMKSTGGGKTSFNLRNVVPVDGQMAMQMQMQMQIEAGGPAQKMSMKMDLDLDIKQGK